MEISKQEFVKWFKSENQQIAANAMQNQWMAWLQNQNPFFSEDELWNENVEVVISGLYLAIQKQPALLNSVILMLQQRVSEKKYLPFDIWPALVSLATYRLKNVDDRLKIRDFVLNQNFDNQELLKMIASVLRCVDRMPEWLKCGMKWMAQVESDVNFCIVLQSFLNEWGRLEEASDELMSLAFDKILPEWAPLMIKSLTNIPGPYRFDLSLCLLKKYFDKQDEEMVKSIVVCFAKDSDVDLQQNFLDGIFDFFNSDIEVKPSVARIFVEGIERFLMAHWGANSIKFERFWHKLNYAPEIFYIIRSSFKNDLNLVLFNKGLKGGDAKLKTPLYMLQYLPFFHNIDLCLLLLQAVSKATGDNRIFACKILTEKEILFHFKESFDDYASRLGKFLQEEYPVNYEVKHFVEAITNALVKYGAEVKNVPLLYDFVKNQNLHVEAMNKCYQKEIETLLQKRSYEREVLNFLLKN